ncbi:MAG: DUF99 family protein [Thaumarchaeota archaeon]|nr:DUF99 family protein [Nitrososphaerota archaeon]
MKLHPSKRAIRALGVAESFRSGDRTSVLAGVVMRSDGVVDGFSFGGATVEGDDGTKAILRLYRSLKRDDVNLMLLSGCIISLYNIIDVDGLSTESGVPVVALTYKESSGLEGAIRRHFGDGEDRIAQYRKLGPRTPMKLHTGYKVYARLAGISEPDAGRILDSFTLQGGVPEPVRLARLLARARRA